MTLIKLEEGGAPVRFLVQRITDDMSKRGTPKPQYKFSGRTDADDSAAIWLYSDSAERQFARVGVTRDTVVGKWVEFSKTSTGFVDLNLAAGATQPALSPALAAPATKAAKPSNAKQAFSSGPALPGEEGYVAPAAATTSAAPADPDAEKAARRAEWERTKKCFDLCVDQALKVHADRLADKGITITHEGIATMAAALFTACTTRGTHG